MAQVQYRDEVRGINISRKMFPPTKVNILEHWLKAALKAIPEVPSNLQPRSHSVTTKYIHWELIDPSTDEKAHLVIDRESPSIG